MRGKIKKSIGKKCPLCNKILQVRYIEVPSIKDGIEVLIEKEFICCSNPNCDYEEKSYKKRRDNR